MSEPVIQTSTEDLEALEVDAPRVGIIAEMGRYAFPAIVALAAAALGGAFFFRPRGWVAPYATALATAVVVLCYSSQLLARKQAALSLT